MAAMLPFFFIAGFRYLAAPHRHLAAADGGGAHASPRANNLTPELGLAA
jgi:hypothetical protein